MNILTLYVCIFIFLFLFLLLLAVAAGAGDVVASLFSFSFSVFSFHFILLLNYYVFWNVYTFIDSLASFWICQEKNEGLFSNSHLIFFFCYSVIPNVLSIYRFLLAPYLSLFIYLALCSLFNSIKYNTKLPNQSMTNKWNQNKTKQNYAISSSYCVVFLLSSILYLTLTISFILFFFCLYFFIFTLSITVIANISRCRFWSHRAHSKCKQKPKLTN